MQQAGTTAEVDFKPERVYRKTVTLDDGHSKQEMLQIGYGSYQVKDENAIFEAIRYGYRYIDTATYYENEEMVGR